MWDSGKVGCYWEYGNWGFEKQFENKNQSVENENISFVGQDPFKFETNDNCLFF